MSLIEDELRRRCEQNHAQRILLAQWEYDKTLVSQSLSTISIRFPHYSLHDSSHAERVLERIASCLGGAALSTLSATDLWLLLEASYWHDIGMVATADVENKDLSSSEFQIHVERLALANSNDLSTSAQKVRAALINKTPIQLAEAHRDLVLVYADFLRVRHADRANDTALNPKRIALDSPRTSAIPRRFWNDIGRICQSHGRNFSSLLLLAKTQTGIGGDEFHPRFIAAMLRLGDLLDLDNSRFCGALMAVFGTLPASSLAHLEKHEGVKELYVGRDRIDVVAEYENRDAYFASEQWFSWLREELSLQLQKWSDISPGPLVGPPPSIGRIEAKLIGQILLSGNARPRFELNREKTLELFRGGNIYRGPQDAIRELIQNSIDATLLRLAQEFRENDLVHPENPDHLRECLKKYPVEVRINRVGQSKTSSTEVEWEIQIHDNGIGFQFADISALLQLGLSSRTPEKEELRHWLRQWARPSGTFGIGFHSIFEYCQNVCIRTRHPHDEHGYVLEFTRSSVSADPTVIVRSDQLLAGEQRRRPGTTVTATLIVEANPDRFTWNPGTETDRVLENYDFITDEELSVVPAKIKDEVWDLGRSSVCHISLNGANNRTARTLADEYYYFDSEIGVELRLKDIHWGAGRTMLSYRDVPIERSYLVFNMADLDVNVLSGDAKDLLSLSRNELTSDGKTAVTNLVKKALKTAAPRWLSQARANGANELKLISLWNYLYYQQHTPQSEWGSVPLLSIDIDRLLAASTVSLTRPEQRTAANLEQSPKIEINDGAIEISDPNESAIFASDAFERLVKKHFLDRTVDFDGSNWTYRLKKSSVLNEDVSDAAFRRFLLQYVFKATGGFVGKRRAIPAPRRFSGLAIPNGERVYGFVKIDFFTIYTLSPGVMTDGAAGFAAIARYVDWLAAKQDRPRNSVAKDLLPFIDFVEELVRDALPGIASQAAQARTILQSIAL